jgi:predicted O-methyltransferase YrrM
MIIKNRQELARYFAQLGFTKGAEIGVCKGWNAQNLFVHIPGLELLAIDSWENVSGTRKEHYHRKSARKQTFNNLEGLNVKIIQQKSTEAAKDIPNGSLDFVFIDADHSYNAVKEDIEAWTPKVKTGGIVSGHDYFTKAREEIGVIKAVDEYVAAHNINLKIIDWDYDNPDKDSRQPCWYFVKL